MYSFPSSRCLAVKLVTDKRRRASLHSKAESEWPYVQMHSTHAHSCILRVLPEELICAIFHELDITTVLCGCQPVCRFFSAIIKNDLHLQYKAELLLAGMEDGLQSPLGVADRLELLRKHQRNWRNMHWTEPTPITTAANINESRVQIACDVVSRTISYTGLAFAQIPSKYRCIPGKEWTLEDLGFDIDCWEIDPSQDLLVVLDSSLATEIKLHVLSLSTGRPRHSNPTLVLHSAFEEGSSFHTICICGHLIGILSLDNFWEAHSPVELLVLDCITGDEILRKTGQIEGLAFLADDLFMIATPKDRSFALEVYKLRHPTSDPPASQNPESPLCSFLLPRVHSDKDLTQLQLLSDLAQSWRSPSSHAVPFHSANHGILTLQIVGADEDRRASIDVLCYISVDGLLDRVSRVRGNSSSGHAFPWEDWGPETCRWFDRAGVRMIGHAHSTRGVRFSSFHEFYVYDFNPRAVRHALAFPHRLDGGTQIVTDSTTTDELRKIFPNPVITSLPYLVKKFTIPFDPLGIPPFRSIYASEDTLVFVPQHAEEGTSSVLAL